MGVCSKSDTLSILGFNNVITQHEQHKTIEVLNHDEFWEARKIREAF